jgi:hypothetical protein
MPTSAETPRHQRRHRQPHGSRRVVLEDRARPGGTNIDAARTSLVSAFRQGDLLMNYVGAQAASNGSPPEGLLLTGDVKDLQNGARLPVD